MVFSKLTNNYMYVLQIAHILFFNEKSVRFVVIVTLLTVNK